jgi:hypothetical protein
MTETELTCPSGCGAGTVTTESEVRSTGPMLPPRIDTWITCEACGRQLKQTGTDITD